MSSAVLEMAEDLPAVGSGEYIPWFALLAHMAFALPVNLSLSLLILSSIPLAAAVQRLVAKWG